MATNYMYGVENSTLTIEKLKDEVGVTDNQLNSTIEECELHTIAGLFGNYSDFLDKFQLNKAEHADVTAKSISSHQSAMKEALRLWYKKDPTKATYRALLQIVLELQQGDTAITICKHITTRSPHKMIGHKPSFLGSDTTGSEQETTFSDNGYSYVQLHVPPKQQLSSSIGSHHETTNLKHQNLLPEHSSYHQEITGTEAEHRLKMFGKRCYLTRYSKSNKTYMLSVCQSVPNYNSIRPKIKHFPILFSKGSRRWFKILDKEFNDLNTMLKYYEQNRVDPAFPDIGLCVSEKNYFRLVREQRLQCSDSKETSLDKYVKTQLSTPSIARNNTEDQRQKCACPCVIL